MAKNPPEVVLTLTILTSPAPVYKAFTLAEGWCQWCCETAEVEARVGGRLHIFTEGYNAYGEFIKLEQDRLIVFSWLGDDEPPTQIRVSLKEADSQTNVTFEVSILDSKGDRSGFVDFLERTWGRALRNLKVVLEEEAGR